LDDVLGSGRPGRWRSRLGLWRGAGERFETLGQVQPQGLEDLPSLRRHRIGRVADHLACDAAAAVSGVLNEDSPQLSEGLMPEHVGPTIAQTLLAERDLGR